MANLRQDSARAVLSHAHTFILSLHIMGRLLRNYTQNIDCLEERAGIPLVESPHHLYIRGGHVRLHGSIMALLCDTCFRKTHFSEVHIPEFSEGRRPDCFFCGKGRLLPSSIFDCSAYNFKGATLENGRDLRQRGGRFYPDVRLYNQPHPSGQEISNIFCNDLKESPDLLCIMGTSLSIGSLNDCITQFAARVKSRKGYVIFINRTPPNRQWNKIFDYHLIGEVDDWMRKIKNTWLLRQPKDWSMGSSMEQKRVFRLAERPVVNWPQMVVMDQPQ
jgi:NAD+-dependent protein deacetylase SIR2